MADAIIGGQQIDTEVTPGDLTVKLPPVPSSAAHEPTGIEDQQLTVEEFHRQVLQLVTSHEKIHGTPWRQKCSHLIRNNLTFCLCCLSKMAAELTHWTPFLGIACGVLFIHGLLIAYVLTR